MRRRRRLFRKLILPTLLVLLCLAMISMGIDELQKSKPSGSLIFVSNPADLKYQPADGLPEGAEIVILRGDTGKAEPYTFRMKLPAGYILPPHWHVNEEQMTVISGTLNVGMGDNVDKLQGRPFTAGTYQLIPGNEHHYLWTQGETVVQIEGIGPHKTFFVK